VSLPHPFCLHYFSDRVLRFLSWVSIRPWSSILPIAVITGIYLLCVALLISNVLLSWSENTLYRVSQSFGFEICFVKCVVCYGEWMFCLWKQHIFCRQTPQLLVLFKIFIPFFYCSVGYGKRNTKVTN
jgi:hypothetical protein